MIRKMGSTGRRQRVPVRSCGSLILCVPFAAFPLWAAEGAQKLDEISVTATREARPTGEVPQAISVVGKETLAEKKMFNLKEALQEMPGVFIDSKNGGFDARLIIRGAGLKAPFGIREIQVLRDGVPLSDPDSFTRLDFVDTQDIERVEVAKGPGNLFAAGAAGGAIQIFSRSVFDARANNLKAGVGNFDTKNLHLRYGKSFGDQALAFTGTYRTMDNDWRRWNQFDTTQLSLKHGLLIGNDATWESELSYAEANAQLPGAMDATQFQQFLATGKQTDTSEPWKHTGRYSKVWFFNTKFEKEVGAFVFKPRLYYNTWYHYHPVTGIINETEKWVSNLGADLEARWRHAQGTLVGGFTVRQERVPDSRRYQYSRVITTTSGGQCRDSATLTGSYRILATCSDAKGRLAKASDETALLTGIYLQESWRPHPRWIIDAGFRYDNVKFDEDSQEFWKYDFATGRYVAGAGPTRTEKTYRLPAPKLAASYRLTDTINFFAVLAQAGQVPSQSEFSNNPALEAPLSRNKELGLKGRGQGWQFDTSVYLNDVSKEIVSVNQGGMNQFVNAGRTRRKGLEFSGSLTVAEGVELGGYLGLTDYKYLAFSEPVRVGSTTVNQDRAGKTLPFIPHKQYGLFVGWKSPTGWKARLSSNTWGEYWMDNANTEKYGGWEWVTNLSVGYERQGHSLTLNADNLFDKRYAMEVKKDTAGRVHYMAAAPRTVMLTYRYDFR